MVNISELVFVPVNRHASGIIEYLLNESYAGFPVGHEELVEYRLKWRQADRDAFENPDTIGRCTFLTCLGGSPIGFASFDPRQRPEIGIIGHNCILPAQRRQGLGTRQIAEVLTRLRALKISKATVTTGEHEFFLASQRMYLACGFQEKRRFERDDKLAFRLIEYQRPL